MIPIREVFLSVETLDDMWRTDVVGASRAISAADVDELAHWFSGDVRETTLQIEAENLFFHPLPSGAYTIGRTIPREPGFVSLLGNRRSFFIQHFVVSAEALERFFNNPVAVFERLCEDGHVKTSRRATPRLGPILLAEPAHAHVDVRALEGLRRDPGATSSAILLQTALDSVCTFFSGGHSPTRLISGLFNLLPISWRPELTFSSDLYFSRSRPFKLIGISRENSLFQLNSGDAGISFCDLSRPDRKEESESNLRAWPRLMAFLLRQGRFSLIERMIRLEFEGRSREHVAEVPPGTDPEELSILAKKWLTEFFPPPRSRRTGPLSLRVFFPNEETPVAPCVPSESAEHGEVHVEKNENESKNDESRLDSKETEQCDPSVSRRDNSFFEDSIARKNRENHEIREALDPPKHEDEFSGFAASSQPTLPISLAIPLRKAVVPRKDSGSSAQQRFRQQRFSRIQEELKRFDSCLARVLLGDQTACLPFRACWRGICSLVSPGQRLELVEEYCRTARDFMIRHVPDEEFLVLQRDLNVLEVFDTLIGGQLASHSRDFDSFPA